MEPVQQTYSFYTSFNGTEKDTQVRKYFFSSAFRLFSVPFNFIIEVYHSQIYIMQASGAYIFRPNNSYPVISQGQVYKSPDLCSLE